MKSEAKNAKEIILSLNKVSFTTFRPVLKSVSWSVASGERWVLLGANGSGKTSLISTLCAYNTPSSGTMSVAGEEYSKTDWREVREKIALVGSGIERSIRPNETVLEVVAGGKFAMINFFGKITDELVEESMKCLKKTGVAKRAFDEWAYISQGERQKVLIARALMVKPVAMLLDEPCTGLDPVARMDFVKFLDRLSKDKSIPAIVLATHQVAEIPKGFGHAIIMRKGSVMKAGKIEEVMTSENLGKAYGAQCKLSGTPGNYELKIIQRK